MLPRLILAPMAGSAGSELAIAVARAGGLGSLPCAMLSAEQIEAEVTAFRGAVDAPINLNFFCHESVPLTVEAAARWTDHLAPLYRELGINSEVSAGGGRRPFDDATASVVESLRPEVVSFHFGLPAPALLDRVRATGAMILSSATTAAEACWLDERGVDGIIAQGLEAGGHRGHFLRQDLEEQLPLMRLLDELRDITGKPLVAAGGIGNKKSAHAAFDAGAISIQVGTAFLLCPEAKTSAVHRAALRTDAETAVTNVFSGRPARGIINRAMKELGPMTSQAPPFPHAAAAMAGLRRAAEAQGAGDFSPLWSGEDRSDCAEVSASEIVSRLLA